jgi:hypothetical protein
MRRGHSAAPDMTATVATAQIASAAGSNAGTSAHFPADDGFPEPSPAAFTGVDASGRDLTGLLYGAVTTAKTLIGSGAGLQGALDWGGGTSSAMTQTATADTAGPRTSRQRWDGSYTHYVRVVSGGCVLALRDPRRDLLLPSGVQTASRCRCTAMPVDRGRTLPQPASTRPPSDYFSTLTTGEQDRIFTKAGAEAIRAGADPVAVVSARRGAVGIDYSSTSKTPPLGTASRADRHRVRRGGTRSTGTRPGKAPRAAGRSRDRAAPRPAPRQRVRLMPETIVTSPTT